MTTKDDPSNSTAVAADSGSTASKHPTACTIFQEELAPCVLQQATVSTFDTVQEAHQHDWHPHVQQQNEVCRTQVQESESHMSQHSLSDASACSTYQHAIDDYPEGDWLDDEIARRFKESTELMQQDFLGRCSLELRTVLRPVVIQLEHGEMLLLTGDALTTSQKADMMTYFESSCAACCRALGIHKSEAVLQQRSTFSSIFGSCFGFGHSGMATSSSNTTRNPSMAARLSMIAGQGQNWESDFSDPARVFAQQAVQETFARAQLSKQQTSCDSEHGSLPQHTLSSRTCTRRGSSIYLEPYSVSAKAQGQPGTALAQHARGVQHTPISRLMKLLSRKESS